ncbi:MAG: PqqD family protein [Anaerolineae bacterium]
MTEEPLTPETRATIPGDILFQLVEDGAVILNADSGLYYGLDEVGVRMWQLIREHGRLGTVHEHLLEEYDAAPEQLWDDLASLAQTMEAEGLVTIYAPATSSGQSADPH